ncbi:hypothetical protein HPHPA4_0684 [Helicobacter pylori Hp A-4]|nr:hypothetical protein [Helicobacter pylori]EJB42943.1 hypothetical protein HPHPA4_0684 [Helicobacter pylori Hp A-4]
MKRSLKNKGAFETPTPQQGGTSHAKKIKNIEKHWTDNYSGI